MVRTWLYVPAIPLLNNEVSSSHTLSGTGRFKCHLGVVLECAPKWHEGDRALPIGRSRDAPWSRHFTRQLSSPALVRHWQDRAGHIQDAGSVSARRLTWPSGTGGWGLLLGWSCRRAPGRLYCAECADRRTGTAAASPAGAPYQDCNVVKEWAGGPAQGRAAGRGPFSGS